MMTIDVLDHSLIDSQTDIEVEQEEMEQRSQSSHTNIAAIGLQITVLIFLLVQTAGISYWAGQMSSKQETAAKTQETLQRNFEIIQAQYQQVSNELSAIKAAQFVEKKGR